MRYLEGLQGRILAIHEQDRRSVVPLGMTDGNAKNPNRKFRFGFLNYYPADAV